jgi:hypothetical protein
MTQLVQFVGRRRPDGDLTLLAVQREAKCAETA